MILNLKTPMTLTRMTYHRHCNGAVRLNGRCAFLALRFVVPRRFISLTLLQKKGQKNWRLSEETRITLICLCTLRQVSRTDPRSKTLHMYM
jgi:hypothetical protein